MSGFSGKCSKSSSKSASIIPKVLAGTLRQRITIQVPSLVSDNRGGGVYNWSDVATVWASVKTFSADSYRNTAQFEYAQQLGRNSYVITMRYGQTLTTAMRIVYREQALQIDSIVNVDSVNWVVQVLCKEVDPGGV